MSYAVEMSQLRNQVEDLQEQVRYYEDMFAIGDGVIPVHAGVRPAVRKVLNLLLAHEYVSNDAVLSIANREPAIGSNLHKVHISLARKWLREQGIDVKIEVVWGHGYVIRDRPRAIKEIEKWMEKPV